MANYYIPAKPTRAEIKVKNSRFIASVSPVFSTTEARDFIARIKSEFPDASHNVPAFIIGHFASMIEHCNDDGEPSGTAGRPVLAVLKGSDLGDAGIVVTRYFGGTKLGTGGLIRAYRQAAQTVLAITPRAIRVPMHTLTIVIPYNLYDKFLDLVKRRHAHIDDKSFQVDVTLQVKVSEDTYPAFYTELQDISHGKAKVEIINSSAEIISID
jgi:uncharacterized YigZ family protein